MKNSSNNNNLMPSQKPSMIDALRAKHDPHYQLASKVEGLGKDLPIQVAQLHKTLSKSFGMQRKTLVRVLGLENRLSNLETAIEIWTTREGLRRKEEEEARAVEEEAQAVESAVAEAESVIEAAEAASGTVEKGQSGSSTATKKKPKKKPKIKLKKKPKVKAKKRKITGKDLKKGTALETPKERAERLERNKQESVAAEEHQKTDEYKDTTTAVDEKGEYLSAAERKRRFKLAKLLPSSSSNDVSPEDVKPDTQAEMGSDEGKKDRIVQFLNVDVKDKLEEINDSLVEIKGVVTTQGDLADDRDESLRQSILSDRKKQREDKLEKKEKSVGDKMLDSVTKPVGNFLNKLVKFVMMTFVGSVINRVMTLLKDPAQLLDPIKRFFNLVIGLVNAVMKGLWNVTGAPMNFIIGGINKGVSSLLDAINKATGLLKLPAIEAPQIPLIPGPPEFEYIPLSKTAQAKNEGVAMAGGGLVPGYEGGGGPGINDGSSSMTTKDIVAATGPSLMMFMEQQNAAVDEDPEAFNGIKLKMDRDGKMPNFGEFIMNQGEAEFNKGLEMLQNNQSVEPEVREALVKKALFIKSQTLEDPNFKGDVAFDINKDIPGTAANRLYLRAQADTASPAALAGISAFDRARQMNKMGYNKGGKVHGSGTGDTVPAMLTPGEFVMSKGAVDQIGVDKLMAMNAAGGGTNKPKLMKFAGGGAVPGIEAPSGRGNNVVVVGGGNKSSSASVSSSGSGQEIPNFSSTNPNNTNIPVIKSLYNIMS